MRNSLFHIPAFDHRNPLETLVGCTAFTDLFWDAHMEFLWDMHAGYLQRSLLGPGFPRQYTSADTNRVCCSALHMYEGYELDFIASSSAVCCHCFRNADTCTTC